VDGGLTACTLGSGPGPMLGIEYERTLLFILLSLLFSLTWMQWV